MKQFNKVTIGILIIQSVFVFLGIISILNKGVANGYEISPFVEVRGFWLFILSSVFLGMSVIILNQVSINFDKRVIVGVIILTLVSNLLILSYPFLREYFIYGGADPLGHLNRIKKIFETGFIEKNNLYPSTHLLFVTTGLITKLDLNILFKIFPEILYLYKLLIMFSILSLLLKGEKGFKLLSCILLFTPFLFSYYEITVYPQYYSLMLFFLGIYALLKYDRTILLLSSVAVLFYHPFTTFSYLVILTVTSLYLYFLGKSEKYKDIGRFFLFVSVIVGISWFLWITNFNFSSNFIRDALINLNKIPTAPRMEELAFITQISKKDSIIIALKNYGAQLLYSIIIIMIFLLYMKKQIDIKIRIILFMAIAYVLTMTFLFFMTKQISIGRFFALCLPYGFYPIFVSLFMLKNNFRGLLKSKEKIFKITISLFLLLIFLLTVVVMYRNPFIHQPNWQVTYSDIALLSWSDDFKDPKTQFVSIGYPIKYLYVSKYYVLPSHFGFPKTSLLHYFPKDIFIIIGKRAIDITLYKKIFIPSNWGDNINFNFQDFILIIKEHFVSKVYDSNSLWVLGFDK